MKVKTYRILDSDEFNALVKSTYGENVQYEFVADEEAHNYTSVTYNNIERGKALDSYDSAKLDGLFAGANSTLSFMARPMIQDMVNRGILDPGNYMIEVFW